MQLLEKVSIYLFIGLSIVFSFVFVDLFPFSLNPLFTKRTTKFSFITIRDSSKRILSNKAFETFLNYGSNYEKAGLKSPPSINNMGNFIDKGELEKHINQKLARFPFLRSLNIHVTNVSADKSGINYERYEFDAANPNYDASAKVKDVIYQEDKYKRRIRNGELLDL
jgi:hypothetical protein